MGAAVKYKAAAGSAQNLHVHEKLLSQVFLPAPPNALSVSGITSVAANGGGLIGHPKLRGRIDAARFPYSFLAFSAFCWRTHAGP